jgi:outer membrane receptor protein involved in Fe transport
MGSQDSTIFTGQIDLSAPLTSGALDWGLKISDIKTSSAQEFFDQTEQGAALNPSLSDDFQYQENIFAAYFNITRDWEQWSLNLGLRAEQTEVRATSKNLGEVNNQYYFELFPKMSLLYSANENNSFGLSYSRSIARPNYESLNPFRYFIN